MAEMKAGWGLMEALLVESKLKDDQREPQLVEMTWMVKKTLKES